LDRSARPRGPGRILRRAAPLEHGLPARPPGSPETHRADLPRRPRFLRRVPRRLRGVARLVRARRVALSLPADGSGVRLEVPHHLVELVLRDLPAGVAGTQDLVRVVPVSPVRPSVPTPAPPAESPEEQEEQEEKEPAESEPEEREAEAESGAGPADRPRDERCGDSQGDQPKEREERPTEGVPRKQPRARAHADSPPSARARSRRPSFSIDSWCGCNFDASEDRRSSKYDTNPSISLNISGIPRGRPTPGSH